MPTQGEDTSTQPPRFHRPHISQEPINDPEPEYVTRNRYQTLEDAQTGRKHMGVASGDPVYLKDAPLSKNSAASDEPMKASDTHQQRGPRPKQTLTHSARYLETPKQGKSIFVSSSKRRKQHRLTILLLIIVMLPIFWLTGIRRSSEGLASSSITKRMRYGRSGMHVSVLSTLLTMTKW